MRFRAVGLAGHALEKYVVGKGVMWSSWGGEDQSERTRDGLWHDAYDYYTYTNENPDRGRIRAKVCEDQPRSSDPCSNRTYQTFNL